jgi:hypothetical protein
MTRPMTKTELAVLASSLTKHEEAGKDTFIPFIIDKMVLGAGIGVLVGVFMLLSDAFGMSSLLHHVTDPFGHVATFLVGGAMFFSPITLAVAVGLAPHSN